MKRYRNIKLDSDVNGDDELSFDDMDFAEESYTDEEQLINTIEVPEV
jgi:DNA-directed RNA polymerase subunit beta'